MMTLYDTCKSKESQNITLINYINLVKDGATQDQVFSGRIAKKDGNIALYKEIKLKTKAVTASCTMIPNTEKTVANIDKMNGFIVIDIDCEVDETLYSNLKNDKYSHVIHRSFGGDGVCIFVKINHDLFLESFHGLAQYYFETI